MMLRLQFNAKLHKAKRSIKLCFLILLLLFKLGCARSMAQGIARFTADTVSLSRYEYVKKNTNNGSDCICSVVNTSMADLATVVMTGAPDSMEVSIDSLVTFNGTHILQPGQQVIAVGNFMGKQVVILNLSPFRVSITVMVLCPD